MSGFEMSFADELDALPLDKVVSMLEALGKLHRAMEIEVYDLALRLI